MLHYTELLNLRSGMKLGPRETKMINSNDRSEAKRDISKIGQMKEK